MNRAQAERQGRRGEGWAALYLQLSGWRVLARRLKNPRGEVDLVARRGKTIAFVEVKWRSRADDLDHAIDARRLKRVAAAASAMAHLYARKDETVRIDVLLLAPWQWPRHITNAWQP